MTTPDSVSDAAGKPRDVNYDLLRVVAMCLVIGVHVVNNYMPVKMTRGDRRSDARSARCSRCSMVCTTVHQAVSADST